MKRHFNLLRADGNLKNVSGVDARWLNRLEPLYGAPKDSINGMANGVGGELPAVVEGTPLDSIPLISANPRRLIGVRD